MHPVRRGALSNPHALRTRLGLFFFSGPRPLHANPAQSLDGAIRPRISASARWPPASAAGLAEPAEPPAGGRAGTGARSPPGSAGLSTIGGCRHSRRGRQECRKARARASVAEESADHILNLHVEGTEADRDQNTSESQRDPSAAYPHTARPGIGPGTSTRPADTTSHKIARISGETIV